MSKTWLCPLCGVQRIKFGETCDNFTVCKNPMNINGRWYLKNYYTQDRSESARGVGISEISDESTDTQQNN